MKAVSAFYHRVDLITVYPSVGQDGSQPAMYVEPFYSWIAGLTLVSGRIT